MHEIILPEYPRKFNVGQLKEMLFSIELNSFLFSNVTELPVSNSMFIFVPSTMTGQTELI